MGGTELKLTDDELYSLVDDWRKSSPKFVKFWGDVQFIKLPSNRRLAYVRPKVEKNDSSKRIITYEGIGESHKWLRLETYGPKIVENITQGIARDLLMYSMKTMQDMDIVGHVHDEVIVECDKDITVMVVLLFVFTNIILFLGNIL